MTGTSVKKINLALQGGGSHGAFTWGVLERLLEEERLKIEGISGTSAGAMNAVLLAQGYGKNGATGAKEALTQFWESVGATPRPSIPSPSVIDKILSGAMKIPPGHIMMSVLQQMLSPHETASAQNNPLRMLLEEIVDIDQVRNCKDLKIFISATNVETGRAKVFSREEITIDAMMASGCLPFSFPTVFIDGVPYWDGGYTGNPALFPLIYNCESPDIAIVQINPLSRHEVPDTPMGIFNRISEIGFNVSLISEMRTAALVQRLYDEGSLTDKGKTRLRNMNMHIIAAEDEMRAFGQASKVNTDMDFLLHLKKLGRETAAKWLEENWETIGKRSSIDIRKTFF